jgi:ABC-type amino acid transport substrate-binding protein
MKMKKELLALGAVALLATSCSSQGFDNSKLVVGLECNYAPFNWTTTTETDFTLPIDGVSGQFADGYDVQVSKYLAEQLDVEVVIKKIEWGALIPALQSGDINAIVAGMSFTEERDLEVDFTSAYYVSDIVAIVQADSGLTDITSIQGLSGYKVVSQLGTVQDGVIDQIDGVIHQPGADTFNTAALSVLAGDSDALIAEYPVARAIVNANPSLAIVSFDVGFTGLDENALSVAVAVAEGNAELHADVNEALAGLSDENRISLMDGAISRSAVL